MGKHIMTLQTFIKMIARYVKERNINPIKLKQYNFLDALERNKKTSKISAFPWIILSLYNKNLISYGDYNRVLKIQRNIYFEEFKLNVFPSEEYKKHLPTRIENIEIYKQIYVDKENSNSVSYYLIPNIKVISASGHTYKVYDNLVNIERENLAKCI